MPPAVRDSTIYLATAVGTTHTAPAPILQTGDLLTAFVVQGTSAATPTSPGWAFQNKQSFSTSYSLTTLTKTATATEPTSYTFTTANRKVSVVIASISNAQADGFVFVGFNGGNRTTFPTGTLTTLADESLLLSVLGTNGTSGAHIAPTNFTTNAVLESGATGTGTGTGDTVLSLASHGLQTAAGLTSNANWATTTAADGTSVLMAVQPPAPAPAPAGLTQWVWIGGVKKRGTARLVGP